MLRNEFSPKPFHISALLPVPFPFHLSWHDEAANTLRRDAEKFSETGKILQSHSPTPEGVGLPRAVIVPPELPKTVIEQTGAAVVVVVNIYYY